MDTFAFIIHPIDPKRDVSRKFPLLGKYLTEPQIDFFSTFFPPIYLSEIEGIRSEATGKEIKGWFIACPYTPKRMMQLPERTVYRKIIQTGKMAQKLGAHLLGLGAHTAVVGDAGITISKELEIPVTTGDSYTVAVAVQSLLEAARQLGIHIPTASAAVVGATGAIGQTCAEIIADQVQTLYLIGRDPARTQEVCKQIHANAPKAQLVPGTDIEVIKNARLVLTVTSDVRAFIQPHHLQSGTVICDVSRPRDVSAQVAAARKDILVIDGGMVDVPGPVNFNFDFGFPPGKAYACMAETIALTLEGRLESYTLGKKIHKKQVQEIDTIAGRHGFKLSGFRSFEKPVTPEHIEHVRQQIQAAG